MKQKKRNRIREKQEITKAARQKKATRPFRDRRPFLSRFYSRIAAAISAQQKSTAPRSIH